MTLGLIPDHSLLIALFIFFSSKKLLIATFLTSETTQNQNMVLRRTKTFLKIIKIITNFPFLTPQIQSNTLRPLLQNNDIIILPLFFHNIKSKQSLFTFSVLNNHCIEKDLKRLKYICRLQSFFCCSCLIIPMSQKRDMSYISADYVTK